MGLVLLRRYYARNPVAAADAVAPELALAQQPPT
jgi:hypothetical protein